jgi:hypothetical protein
MEICNFDKPGYIEYQALDSHERFTAMTIIMFLLYFTDGISKKENHSIKEIRKYPTIAQKLKFLS